MRKGWWCALALALLLCACRLPSASLRPPQSASESASESEPPPESEQEPPDPNFPVTVAGVTLEEKPQRVVSLNPSITEVLCDLGLAGSIAGIGGFDAYPEAILDRPRCGTEVEPDVPAILAAGAQAVLTIGQLPERARGELEEAGVQLLRFEKPEEVERLPDYYRELARALLGEEDGPAAAKALADPLLGRYEEIKAAASALSARPLGAYMAALPLTMATADSLQGRLLSACGVENAGAQYSDWSYPEELLIPFNPEVLVLDARTVSPEDAAAHPNYKTTPCVQNGRVLAVDGGALENGGARLFEIAGQIARLAGAQLPEQEEPEAPSGMSGDEKAADAPSAAA